MAVTADKVVVELELRDGQYLSRVRQSEQAFSQSQNRVARSAEDAERRIRASSAGISSALKSAAAGIAAGVSVAAVKNLADTYTQLQNRLKVTGLEGAALAAQYERLNQVATDSRTGIEATVQVYSRLRLATEGLGISNADVTRTTEILGKALSSSGATAQETSAALLQFSQAIGSGVLQGDELRSIRENAPAVARAIATEFGVTVGELKKLGEEGKLTSDRVVQAVLKSGTEIDALFAKTEATVGNALTNLGNQLLNYVGQTDDSLSATQRLAGAINLLADNLDAVLPTITAIAVLFGARYTSALIASTLATDGLIGKSRLAAASIALDERTKTTAAVLASSGRVTAINAEIAALTRQVATGRAANGQFISQAAATQSLSVATAQLTVAQNAAAAANLRANGAILGGVTAAKQFGTGLLALAGGPVGASILAVAALAAGIGYLINQQSDAVIAAKAEEKAKNALLPVNSELEKLTRDLVGANAEETKSIREKIAALVDEAKLKATIARQAYLVAKDEIRVLQERERQLNANNVALPSSGAAGGGVVPSVGRAGGMGPNGNPIDTVTDTPELRRLRAEAEALEKGYDAVAEAAADATTAVTRTTGGGSGNSRGPSAETIARREEAQRRRVEDVAAEEELAVAQARNDEDTIRRLERQADIRARQRDIIDASTDKLIAARTVEQALAEATSTQEKIDTARLETRERLTAEQQLEFDIVNASVAEEYERLRALERQKELAELIASFKSLEYDEVEATRRANEALLQIEAAREVAARRRAETQALELEAQIARLENDSVSLKEAERELEIQERTLELLRERKDLTEEQAKNIATRESDQKDAAALIGGLGNPEDAGEVRQAAYDEAQRLREEDLISEADYAQRKLQIDAEYWDARTAGTRTMLDTLAGLQNSSNKKLAAIGKAAAITQATIDGVLAVQKALASAPPPFNFIQAAIVGAVAAANVASIAGLKDGGIVTGSGGPREDNQLRRLSVGEFVNNAESVRKNRPYLEAANNGADLSKLLPGLRDGGYVSRVNVATPRLSDVSRRSVSNVFSPSIDARGADLAAVSRIEQIMEEQSRTFADRVNGVRDRRNAYRLGGRK